VLEFLKKKTCKDYWNNALYSVNGGFTSDQIIHYMNMYILCLLHYIYLLIIIINYLSFFSQSSKKVVVNLEKEAAMLTELRHPNVVQFSGVVWEPPNLGIAMPLALHGSLSAFIGQHDVHWPMKVRIERRTICF